MDVLGIDIGGSGTKAAIVDADTGEWRSERFRIDTPQPAQHGAMLEALAALARHFSWKGPVGCGFPGVILDQEIKTAVNLDPSLVGRKLGVEMAEFFGRPARLINDADAAGLAEMAIGHGRGKKKMVLFMTVGTGIGTAIFYDGKLVPNSEFGHLWIETRGDKFLKAEHFAADSARKRETLTWEAWAERFNLFLEQLYFVTRPDEMIVGGGVAKKGAKFLEYLRPPCPLVLAKLQNRAGITGAAMAAARALQES